MKKKKQKKKDKTVFDKNGVMALSFGALNVADYMTTRKILKGGGEEYNPVANFLMRKNCFGIFKTVATLAGMLAIYGDEKPKIMSKALLGLYGAVVANNIKEIVQHGRETKEDLLKYQEWKESQSKIEEQSAKAQ
jgi:hypothetical protein